MRTVKSTPLNSVLANNCAVAIHLVQDLHSRTIIDVQSIIQANQQSYREANQSTISAQTFVGSDDSV